MGVMIERKKKIMIMQEGNILPNEYQQVEYVFSNEGKIDLNYVPTVSPRAVITMMFTYAFDRDVMGFTNNVSPSFIIDASTATRNAGSPKWYNRYGSTTSFNLSVLPYINEKHSWEFGRLVKYDSEIIDTISEADWSNNAQSFNLLGARNSHRLRVYDFKLYDGETLIRNLIPCYRKSDNVVGFYDTVSKTLFTSLVGTLSIPS